MIFHIIDLVGAMLVSAGTVYGLYKQKLESMLTARIEQYLDELRPRVEAIHLHIKGEQMAIHNDAKILNLKSSQHAQNADKMLVEVRQAMEGLAELEVKAATHLQHTEQILNEPHIRRYLRSG